MGECIVNCICEEADLVDSPPDSQTLYGSKRRRTTGGRDSLHGLPDHRAVHGEQGGPNRRKRSRLSLKVWNRPTGGKCNREHQMQGNMQQEGEAAPAVAQTAASTAHIEFDGEFPEVGDDAQEEALIQGWHGSRRLHASKKSKLGLTSAHGGRSISLARGERTSATIRHRTKIYMISRNALRCLLFALAARAV